VNLAGMLARIEPIPFCGCWIWLGAMASNGYGSVRKDGRTDAAHRAVYQAMGGVIPDGLDLDHLCRVRICVNPTHLEPVTRLTNLQRAAVYDTLERVVYAPKRAQTHCKRGHPLSGDNLRLKGKRRMCIACHRIKTNESRQRSGETK